MRLSARQHEVARCVAEGMTDSEIAAKLGISPRTARMHCDALRARLGVERRRQIPYAYRSMIGVDPFGMSQPPLRERSPAASLPIRPVVR